MISFVELCVGLIDSAKSIKQDERIQWDVAIRTERACLTKMQLETIDGIYYKVIVLWIIFETISRWAKLESNARDSVLLKKINARVIHWRKPGHQRPSKANHRWLSKFIDQQLEAYPLLRICYCHGWHLRHHRWRDDIPNSYGFQTQFSILFKLGFVSKQSKNERILGLALDSQDYAHCCFYGEDLSRRLFSLIDGRKAQVSLKMWVGGWKEVLFWEEFFRRLLKIKEELWGSFSCIFFIVYNIHWDALQHQFRPLLSATAWKSSSPSCSMIINPYWRWH